LTLTTNNEEGAALVVHVRNSGTSRGNGTTHDKDTGERVNPVQDMKTRSEEVEATDASVMFGVCQPRLEVVIHKTTASSSPEANVAQLQRDITTLGTKYEFLQQEALESTEGRRRLEEERGEWVLEKSRLHEEFEVLRRREEQLERLHAAEKNKCVVLA
jgi:hypothetical protein